MISAEACLTTLVAVAQIDDAAVLPLGHVALTSYEAACLGSSTSRLKQMRLLALEFARLSQPTRSAALISDEIADRMIRIAAI